MPPSIEHKTIAELEYLLSLEPYNRAAAPPLPSAPRQGLPKWAIFTLGVAVSAGVSYFATHMNDPQQQTTSTIVPYVAPSPSPIPAPVHRNSAYDVAITNNLNLSAHRTTITGIVDPASMSAAYYLAMYISNNSSSQQEAIMKLKLPKGAAVTRATLWVNGVAQEAAFTDHSRAEQAYNWVTYAHRDPLLVEQIDPETILIKASPIMPGKKGLKLRIGITAPLTRTASGDITGETPYIGEKNFSDGKLDIHLQSPTALIRSHVDSVSTRSFFLAASNVNPGPFAVRATHASNGGYIVVTPENGKLVMERQLEAPVVPLISDPAAAARVSTLWAHDEIERLASNGQYSQAVDFASAYRVISSVSGAVVLEKQSDYEHEGLDRDMNQKIWSEAKQRHNPDAFESDDAPQLQGSTDGLRAEWAAQHSAPLLQGATNGTIGPQGNDATVIQGVNTAGTVRVNNLANAEAALNVVANAGGPIAANTVNWLTASARDANLFTGGEEIPTSDYSMPTIAAIAIAFLPLIGLNLAPALFCAVRGIGRAAKSKTGAARLLMLAVFFGLLAVYFPLANQVLCIGILAVLARRHFLRRRAMQFSRA